MNTEKVLKQIDQRARLERLSAMMLQGMLAAGPGWPFPEHLESGAQRAVDQAKALIKILDALESNHGAKIQHNNDTRQTS